MLKIKIEVFNFLNFQYYRLTFGKFDNLCFHFHSLQRNTIQELYVGSLNKLGAAIFFNFNELNVKLHLLNMNIET